MIDSLGVKNDFNVVHSDTKESFMDKKLHTFDAVIFLCTTLNVLNELGQENLKEFNNLGAKNYVRYEKRRWQEDNEGHEWHEEEEKAS